MNDGPICKICGHHGDRHRFRPTADGGVVCTDCPDRVCQDGPGGRKHRERKP